MISLNVPRCLHSDVAGPSHHHWVRSVFKELLLGGPVLVLLFLLLFFIDLVKVLHHGTFRPPRASHTGRDTMPTRNKTSQRIEQTEFKLVPETVRFTSLCDSSRSETKHQHPAWQPYVTGKRFFF